MERHAGLRTILLIAGGSLLWCLLMAGVAVGIGMGPARAQHGWSVSIGSQATASLQRTPTVDPTPRPVQQKQHGAQSTTKSENTPALSWIALAVLLLCCAVLLAAVVLLFWGKTHPARYRTLREKAEGVLPWHQRGQPAGWTYEVLAGLLAALAVGTGLAAQVLVGTVSTGPVVLLLVAVALGLAAAVATLRATQRKNKRRWAQQVRGLLKEPPGKDGELRLLSTLNPYHRLGVSPSPYSDDHQRGGDPYVPRTATDRKLDEALPNTRFVLVVGDSKAGKSRTAYEAAKRLSQDGQPHDPRVLVPNSTHDLGPLLDLDPSLDLRPEPALLWLDDLTPNDLVELTPARLDRLTEKMIVLGTMTALNHSLVVESDSGINRAAQEALQRAKSIRLEAALDNEERADAEQKYPRERFEAGIGEQLVSLGRLIDKYQNASQGADPHGWAVVQAAIDWTRMDIGRPITQHELVALCPLYLHHLRPLAEHDDKDHEEALRRACQPVVSHNALLMKGPSDRGESSYEPFDYFVAVADGQDGSPPKPISDDAWDTVVARVSPSERLRAGGSAYLRRLLPRAETIFTALAAGKSDAAPMAAYNLGMLYAEEWNWEPAKKAFQQAIDRGDADLTPAAAITLGILLAEYSGTVKQAKAAYQRAIDSRHPVFGPQAAILLGVLLYDQVDVKGAKAAYQRAIDSGNPESGPQAAVLLGWVLLEQGDIEEAKVAYQRAIDSGHAEWAPKAAARLDELLHGGPPPPTAS